MKRLLLAWSLCLIYTAARAAGNKTTLPVDYSAPVEPDSRPQVTPVSVDHLQKQTNELKGAAADNGRNDSELHDRASRLFDQLNEDGSVVVTPRLEGWGRPDPYTADASQDQGGVDGMLNRVGMEIGKQQRKKGEIAPPSEVIAAYGYGKSMRARGLMDYTDALNSNQLGVYVYKPNTPIGIFFNTQFYQLQAILGDAFAAATAVHESAHNRDHEQGRLNSREVKRGEMMAYQSEYWWIRTMDPKGHKLAWARVTFCSDFKPGDQNNVCEYLEHLAMILRYGSQNDFYGLVTALGYRDRTSDPFKNGGNAETLGGGGGDFNDRFVQDSRHEDPPVQSVYSDPVTGQLVRREDGLDSH